MATPDKFICFYALPKELRDLIWVMAFENLTVILLRYKKRRLLGTSHPLSYICVETRDLLFRQKPDRLMMGPDIIPSPNQLLPIHFDQDICLIQVHFQDMASLLQCVRIQPMENLVITISANPDTPWSEDEIPPELDPSLLQNWVTDMNQRDLAAGLQLDERTLRMCIFNKRSDFFGKLFAYQSLLNTYELTGWGPLIPAICLVQ
ncbi:hypothetical protein F4821DRAFT_264589 [Hypoxylon rubiginosum]|uniref:Uncharacterized protein n=1 Tax=Hypoxylon rubiginosum TaxID=110542 RepID=A0ACC0CMV1_9PEZI|nr:hypothetical protein F4821DRAFT_264589 [Hypoxylon rubiginosum]